jgi:hypothetical protein
MGWKLSSIIINPSTDIHHENLLSKLGFKNLEKLEDQSYDIAMYPDKDQVYIGNYKNNLIICSEGLPLKFFENSLTDLEKTLIKCFPDSEICAVSLQSTINHFGFAVIKNGEKIRVKSGDADLGTVIDIGPPLEQEKELLSKSKMDDNGQRLYHLDNFDETFQENQVGENFIVEIFKRYTGESLDTDDDLLDTDFAAYKFSEEEWSYDGSFSGEWQGEFSYGDSYQDVVKDKVETFVLNFQQTHCEIKGFCVDGNKQLDEPATINGFLFDNFIGFVKRYPFRYFFDKQGVTHKEESKESNNIFYSGLYDPLTDSFKGIWRIENKKFWGGWTMKRKS